jgi:flagellar basal body-associated protein FliL
MKKSYWVIFAIVLFVLALIIVIGIFVLSNKPDDFNENQPDMAKKQYRTSAIVHSRFITTHLFKSGLI